jgi:hypothetical protein
VILLTTRGEARTVATHGLVAGMRVHSILLTAEDFKQLLQLSPRQLYEWTLEKTPLFPPPSHI